MEKWILTVRRDFFAEKMKKKEEELVGTEEREKGWGMKIG